MAVASLCSSDEQVVFSCATTQKKVVSICASSDLTATAGYLQYRIGTPGKTPELTFPSAKERPKARFQSGTLMFSGGGGAYLTFNNDAYNYSIFTGIGKGWEKEGVVVKKDGRQVSYLQCQNPWTSQLGPDWFAKVGIPIDPNAGDFEIP